MKKIKCLLIMFMVLFTIINIPIIYADGENWLDGWTYRKELTISYASGSGTNYQIYVNINYGSGSDSGSSVYLDSKCETDFVDIRFTEDDGSTLLYAYNRTQVDSDYCNVHFKVTDDLSSSDVTVYLYYGNSEATAYWDGENTYIRWDDFDLDYSVDDLLNSTRGWSTEGISGGSYILIKNNPSGSGQVLRIEENGDSTNTIAKLDFNGDYDSIAIGFDYLRGQDRTTYLHVRDDADAFWANDVDWTNDYWRSYDGSWSALSPNLANSYNTWYLYEFRYDYNYDYCAIYYNGGLYIGDLYNYNDGGDLFWFLNLRTQVGTLYLDNVYIRKFVYDEPDCDTWGEEETQPEETYYITINFNSSVMGSVYVNCTEITVNGTEVNCDSGNKLFIQACTYNQSYVFINYTSVNSTITINPYKYYTAVASNDTINCYFDIAGSIEGEESEYTEEELFGFGLVMFVFCLTLVTVLIINNRNKNRGGI